METQHPDSNLSPFILLTDRLIIVPTPIAIQFNAYVHLYGGLHASEAFCAMAFGPHFPARNWNDEETREVILTRDIERCWKKRGLGDFAVARRVTGDGSGAYPREGGRKLKEDGLVRIVEDNPDLQELESAEWVGYAGVRDATTTSMPDPEEGDKPLPSWQEMVELRYGVHGDYWGKGIAGEAARAVMQWATSERGVRRFVAETEKTNVRSGKVLQKMGFKESGTEYWKEPSEVEWEKVVV
jgi:RimJ/RimL family protein N-acetyltransferase